MDDTDAGAAPEEHPDTTRQITAEDLVSICRSLNEQGARYVVIGGMAIRAAGYLRETFDLDLMIATDLENEARVFRALECLPDRAVKELMPGEVSQYVVVRVCDEITVDLMASATGIEYAEASQDVVIHQIEGVCIPFASPRLLWRMKRNTHREKDQADLAFLRQQFPEALGE